ncbi:hypothetical protein TRAPUB_13629 [Trametes pubescens]|uniref:Uncharacterized protein n=1 Tax=Trametes pubescens TaxID=154538 RepID=A0A1M2VQN8_TRAPU|nr:hypothetical protein TRAPUB_13629 [Trametes pubescens]
MDDKPYVPQTGEQSKDKGPALFLSPDELAPSSSYDTYVYRDAAPQEPPQTLSPRDLTMTLPQNSPPAPPRQFRETSPARYARAYHVKRTIARVAAAKELSQVNSHDSDGEADASSGDDASEDEYVPSPRIRPRKLSSSNRFQPNQQQGRTKPRAAPRAAYSPYPPSSASATSASGSATECSSGAGSSRRAGSRNIQVIDQPPPPRGSWDKTGPNAYQCPWCDHIQRNKRSPDMERHIRSHFRRAADSLWVCCGLPPDEAAQYGVGPNENGWQFNGRYMVGGCHEDFSRMDALKRHWRNTNNSCIGAIQYARMEPTEPTQ